VCAETMHPNEKSSCRGGRPELLGFDKVRFGDASSPTQTSTPVGGDWPSLTGNPKAGVFLIHRDLGKLFIWPRFAGSIGTVDRALAPACSGTGPYGMADQCFS